jgi:hypothetical protein
MKTPIKTQPPTRQNDPAEDRADAAAVDAIPDQRAGEIDGLREEWLSVLRRLGAPGFNDALESQLQWQDLTWTLRKEFKTDQLVRASLGADGISKLRTEIEHKARAEYRRGVSKAEYRRQFEWEVLSGRRRHPRPQGIQRRTQRLRACCC